MQETLTNNNSNMNSEPKIKVSELKDVSKSEISLESNRKSPLEPASTSSSASTEAGTLLQQFSSYVLMEPCNRPSAQTAKECPVYFFDLDNTLYRKSSGIPELMVRRIELYLMTYLNLPLAESRNWGAKFYRDYGLAIKGLIRHFAVDPVEYDRFCDGGLPLDEILAPNTQLQDCLNRLSRRGACWIFTNAGKFHAERVLKLLQIDQYFSGIIYCDYSEPDFPSKPDRLSFQRAMQCAAVEDPRRCYFFDDSVANVRSAQEIGWNVVYIDEDATIHSAASHSTSIEEISNEQEISRQITNKHAFPTVRFVEEVELVLHENEK